MIKASTYLATSSNLRLVFFLYTSLEISPKLGYVFHIRALARLISASSKEKILRLDFLIFKFEAESYKFNCKFRSKATRRSIVR